jgi:hypothetical protein
VLSLRTKLNPFFEKRKNQSFPAQKITKTSPSIKKWHCEVWCSRIIRAACRCRSNLRAAAINVA